MEETKSKNIVVMGERIHIYIPAYRFYSFAFFLLLGALIIIGGNVFICLHEPEMFVPSYLKQSLIYLSVMVLALLLIIYEFIKIKRQFKNPQMLIGKEEIHFKRNGKGSPLLTSDYVSLKYKDIISATYSYQHDYTGGLTFLTTTQLYPVGLILDREEKKIVCKIIKSKLEADISTRSQRHLVK